jgi:hypothetical protein
MNKITWFKGYLQELQNTIAAINRNRMVIDKSQLTKYLNDHQSTQNYLLIGVLPDFSGKASDPENFMLTNTTQLMVLSKTTYSEHNYDQFYQIFEDTYDVVELIVQKLITDSLNGCTNLRFLDAQSIQIQPVWNESACNGWKILFNFDIHL